MIEKASSLIKLSSFKKIASIALIVATLAAFVIYFYNHPETLEPIRQSNPLVIVALFALYGMTMVALAVVLSASLTMCGKRLPIRENILVTIYSAVVNFFGPLQSGPGFRAIYFKKRHNIKIKDLAVVTLVYYFFFGIISCLILLLTSEPLMVILCIILGVAFAAVCLKIPKIRSITKKLGAIIQIKPTIIIAIATMSQILLIALIYHIEIISLGESVTFWQSLSYTGAANLAMFVSITPGAIGIREAFLVFSQNIHGVATDITLAASLIDRAVYISFLGLIFLATSALHLGNKLKIMNQ